MKDRDIPGVVDYVIRPLNGSTVRALAGMASQTGVPRGAASGGRQPAEGMEEDSDPEGGFRAAKL